MDAFRGCISDVGLLAHQRKDFGAVDACYRLRFVAQLRR